MSTVQEVKTVQEPLFTQTELKSRGWTGSLIKGFLPEPYKIRPNFYYRKGPPVKLYRPADIEQIESQDDFKLALQKLSGRKAGAKKSVQTKLAAIQKYVSGLKFEIPLLTREALLEAAIDNYNSFRDRDFDARKTSDGKFLRRIQVNYLRHCESDYDSELGEIYSKVGAKEAYLEIRTKVLDEIARLYPWLAEECLRQKKDAIEKSLLLASESV